MTEAEQIAKFIREKGVTRCPDAILNETTARLSEADVAIHKARGIDPMGVGVFQRGQ